MTLLDHSNQEAVRFTVKDGDDTFTDYGISHTKEMHIIVVRDDLRHFAHLHPERDAEGIWRIVFTPDAGGDYWLYADFVEDDDTPHTIRFERSYAGDQKAYGLEKSDERIRTVDRYTIELQSSREGEQTVFAYRITDAKGEVPKLEEYLGAKGHSVLISPSGDFIHTHPSTSSGQAPEEEGELPTFIAKLAAGSFHRMFTQFQIEGEVLTVFFDWETE